MARSRARQQGFAFLTVLWTLTTISVVALSATAVGRDSFNASQNRILLARARWRAEGCAARAHAAMDSLLSTDLNVPGVQASIWRAMGDVLEGIPAVAAADCTVSAEAAGTRLDVNAATGEELDRLFTAMGMADVESARDALLDWMDPDDQARSNGAESASYSAAQRVLPRNGPIADARELIRIRGFEDRMDLQSVLSAEPGRISIATAPAPVLAAIPGFTAGMVQRILEIRAQGDQVTDLVVLVSGAAQADAEEATSRFADISRLATVDPDAWIVSFRAVARTGAPVFTLEERLVRKGSRIVVMRTRVSP